MWIARAEKSLGTNQVAAANQVVFGLVTACV
jgi:hypothetical protein